MLASKVSAHFINKYLLPIPDGRILDIFFNGGEIINCLLMSFNVIYSSKSIRSSLISRGTLILELSILLPITSGGMLSLAPPTGDPTRAHEAKRKLMKTKKKILFMKRICAKLRNLFTVTIIGLILFQRVGFVHCFLKFLDFIREIFKQTRKCQSRINPFRIFVSDGDYGYLRFLQMSKY